MKGVGPGVTGSSTGGGHTHASWLRLHKVAFFEGMFLSFAALNILDLWTSAIALGRGLDEGNLIVVRLANALGLGVFGGLALVKMAALAGGLGAAVIGIRTRSRFDRRIAMGVMMFLVVLMLAVSVNNLVVLGA